MAVNHSGDSDSTGAIAAGILGTWLGIAEIPARWLNRLEICTAIERMALDIGAASRETDSRIMSSFSVGLLWLTDFRRA
jgi:hypothetical protein